MTTRRNILNGVKPQATTHPGLWLDKYMAEQTRGHGGDKGGGSDDAKWNLLVEATERRVPTQYAAAMERRSRSFQKVVESGAAQRVEATVEGRLVIGLGNKNVAEIGLTLDHTWGMPFLPGSALKGLASRTAHSRLDGAAWRRPSQPGVADGGEWHQFLFGSLEQAGAVIFHDAWWRMDGTGAMPLDLDVMTVHHRDYYGGKDAPPSDMDSPVPVPFLTVHGTFEVVVEKSRPDVDAAWLDLALEILKTALAEEGLGAKTNAGYGRMGLAFKSAQEAREEAAQEAAVQSAAADQRGEALLTGLEPNNAGDRVSRLLDLYDDDPVRKAEMARRAISALGKKFLDKKADKAYVKRLLAAARGE